MKKALFWMMLITILMFPFHTFAKEVEVSGKKYTYQNLEEALAAENIEKAYDNYEENDNQVPIYLFRGDECEYCVDFLEFLNSITNEYGEYFKLVSFEVYNNSDNNDLMTVVADYVGAKGESIPFAVIGNQFFEGYSSEYNDSIKESIKGNYDVELSKRADIIRSINNKENSNSVKRSSSQDFKIIAWNFIFITIATSIIIIFLNYKITKLDDKVSMINNKTKH